MITAPGTKPPLVEILWEIFRDLWGVIGVPGVLDLWGLRDLEGCSWSLSGSRGGLKGRCNFFGGYL